jgi:hypothetical protein
MFILAALFSLCLAWWYKLLLAEKVVGSHPALLENFSSNFLDQLFFSF